MKFGLQLILGGRFDKIDLSLCPFRGSQSDELAGIGRPINARAVWVVGRSVVGERELLTRCSVAQKDVVILHKRRPFSRLTVVATFGTLFLLGLRRVGFGWWQRFFICQHVVLQVASPIFAERPEVDCLACRVERDSFDGQLCWLHFLFRGLGKFFRQSRMIESAVPRSLGGIDDNKLPRAAR